ncbi:Uncharacterised protein [Klebsiella pneumoniae]|uniref:Uncharacterized protein n=1 Tax=Klebsiella pneumoniae TaxID=573 RepID=A0A447RFV3_KLEPN|nr:Uncharacterised protein [Klebsiella pneumoniae]
MRCGNAIAEQFYGPTVQPVPVGELGEIKAIQIALQGGAGLNPPLGGVKGDGYPCGEFSFILQFTVGGDGAIPRSAHLARVFPRTHGAFRVAGIPFAVHQALGCQKVLFEGRYGQTRHRAGCEMQGGQVDEIAVQFATGRSPQMSAEGIRGAGVKTGEGQRPAVDDAGVTVPQGEQGGMIGRDVVNIPARQGALLGRALLDCVWIQTADADPCPGGSAGCLVAQSFPQYCQGTHVLAVQAMPAVSEPADMDM